MNGPDASAAGPRPSRLGIFSWCVYDWANQPFPTLISTFVFPAYFARAVAETPEAGTSLWGLTMSLAGLAVAVVSPVLGAVADQGGRRKPWILAMMAACVVLVAMLWFVRPEPADIVFALVFVGLASVASELGNVFYNAMLPALAPSRYIGRVSGWGWGLGYLGGITCLTLTLFAFVRAEDPLFGLDPDTAENVRIVGPLVAAWFALFAIPLFLFTPDRARTGKDLSTAARDGIRTLINTLRHARRYAQIARFLLARMIYTDGLNTLFSFGGIYAAGTFDMDVAEVIQFGIAMNVTAGLGALSFAWVDDWIGPKRTILIAIVAMTLLGGGLLLVESTTLFWILALPLALFFGPAQAASRSMMARLAPEHLRAEMFGLYAFSGKATAFIGPALLGWVTAIFASQRAGMATIIIFFVVGFVLLLPLKEPRE